MTLEDRVTDQLLFSYNVDDYSPSQLIMISHNRLAQYWEGFGHISHFERVDIDALIRGMATRTTTSAPSTS